MIRRLLIYLILGGIIYVLYRVLWKGEGLDFFRSEKKKKNRAGTPTPNAIEEMKKDPVCGTYIPEKQAIIYMVNRSIHYFCSEECKQKFIGIKENKNNNK